ncbi:50S ribosomal protein L37ae [archaeon SCG-AAA382B04]|nr:50S ribosomal protein L37ae [archaeon SCG-AAA382B04]
MPEESSSDLTKRFGARYGRKIRKKVSEIEKKQKDSYECPNCKSQSLKRKASGIWICQKCGTKQAGGAYQPETSTGEAVKKALREEEEEE